MEVLIMILTIILAILPILLIGIFYYQKDTLKEPFSLLSDLFLSGMVAAFMVVFIAIFVYCFAPDLISLEKANFLKLFLYNFIYISLIEESFKWLMIYLISYKNSNYDQMYDIILYAVFVSLGFAIVENLLYLNPNSNNFITIVFRSLTAIPAHACYQTFMGYFLTLSKFKKKRKGLYLTLSLLVPVLIHGLYDFLLSLNQVIYVAIFLIFIIVIYLLTILNINKVVKLDKLNLMKK